MIHNCDCLDYLATVAPATMYRGDRTSRNLGLGFDGCELSEEYAHLANARLCAMEAVEA